MGPDFGANGRQWKTPPLWARASSKDVNGHTRLLHDGRARGAGGHPLAWRRADAAREQVLKMKKSDRDALVKFVGLYERAPHPHGHPSPGNAVAGVCRFRFHCRAAGLGPRQAARGAPAQRTAEAAPHGGARPCLYVYTVHALQGIYAHHAAPQAQGLGAQRAKH